MMASHRSFTTAQHSAPLSGCHTWACGLQAFLMRKLKIGGSMALALKLQPILDAAAPRAKL